MTYMRDYFVIETHTQRERERKREKESAHGVCNVLILCGERELLKTIALGIN